MRGKIIHYNHAESKGLALSAQESHAFVISRRLSDSAPQINQTVGINSHAGHMMAARQVDNRMPALEQLQSWCRQVGEFM